LNFAPFSKDLLDEQFNLLGYNAMYSVESQSLLWMNIHLQGKRVYPPSTLKMEIAVTSKILGSVLKTTMASHPR
jgi:hypothetical protein